MYKWLGKRFFDLVVASLGLLILMPVFLLVVLLLAIANRGSIFFVQLRPGKDQLLFPILKFRTMNDDVDEQGVLLPDEQRLTAVGKWIRKTSLDELPQLLNVMRGDMSLVGPRPLLEEYIPLYTQEQNRRHSVRPGITGWAQVNGRNALDWEEKFRYDIEYVDSVSFWLDLQIIGMTIVKVLTGEGTAEGGASMSKFRGSHTNLEIGEFANADNL